MAPESPEIWALFSAEASEHLEELDAGLLRLEKVPDDRATLERVFRAAHSLKGASRMMGAHEVETLSHAFEDALSDAKKEGAELAPQVVEALYHALDGLRALVYASVSGEAPTVNLGTVLTALRESSGLQGEIPLSQPTVAPLSFPESSLALPSDFEPVSPSPASFPSLSTPSASTFSVATPSDSALAESPQTDSAPVALPPALPVTNLPVVEVVTPRTASSDEGGSGWKIETMRVDPARLDALLSLSGELLVGAKRARRGKLEVENAQSAREEALKITVQKRRLLRQIESALESSMGSAGTSLVREMERLIAREGEKWEILGVHFERLRVSADEVANLEQVATELEVAIRGVRLLPLSTLFGQFPRAVRDLAKSQNKHVEFLLEGGEVSADKRILEELKDPLLHLIRNAIDHGIESPAERLRAGKDEKAALVLRASQTATQIVVEVEDDGRGLSAQKIGQSAVRKGLLTASQLEELSEKQIEELIFAPGFSTAALVTDLSGRGVGLDIVRENVENLRGQITVESVEGRGCTFRLALPVTLATTRVLLVRASEQTFAIPIDAILSVHHLGADALYLMQGHASFTLGDEAVPTAFLRDMLHLPAPVVKPDQQSSEGQSYIVLSVNDEKVGVGVDLVVDEQEIILKSLGRRFRQMTHLAGATILENGDVCLVLNPQELFKFAFHKNTPSALATAQVGSEAQKAPKNVLLCEDSITTRTQEKRILESAGYTVTVAVDGADGWGKLRAGRFDALVTDVEMPNMDGFELTRRVREHAAYSELPIILVTTLSSDADRQRGLEVGASAYITKGGFEGRTLIEALRQLV